MCFDLGVELLFDSNIDNHVKVEARRLKWIRRNQSNIQYEKYQRSQYALHGRIKHI